MDKTPQSETNTARHAKRSGAFFRSDVNECVNDVAIAAEQYSDEQNFIRAVILQLRKLLIVQ